MDINIVSAIVGAIVGAVLSGPIGWHFARALNKKERNEDRILSAQTLFQDIISIQDYYTQREFDVKIRCLDSWIDHLSRCKASDNTTKHITILYDSIFNYNEIFDRHDEKRIDECRVRVKEILNYTNHPQYLHELKDIAKLK